MTFTKQSFSGINIKTENRLNWDLLMGIGSSIAVFKD